MTDLDYSDEQLMAELAKLVELRDPVPPLIVTQARASYHMTTAWDVALAELVYDSSNDDHDSRALVRAGVGTRELTFEGPSLTVEVEVAMNESARRDRCRILGQLIPAQPARIELRDPDGKKGILVKADALGRFSLDDAPLGPVSLRCTPTHGEPTDTEWTVI